MFGDPSNIYLQSRFPFAIFISIYNLDFHLQSRFLFAISISIYNHGSAVWASLNKLKAKAAKMHQKEWSPPPSTKKMWGKMGAVVVCKAPKARRCALCSMG